VLSNSRLSAGYCVSSRPTRKVGHNCDSDKKMSRWVVCSRRFVASTQCMYTCFITFSQRKSDESVLGSALPRLGKVRPSSFASEIHFILSRESVHRENRSTRPRVVYDPNVMDLPTFSSESANEGHSLRSARMTHLSGCYPQKGRVFPTNSGECRGIPGRYFRTVKRGP
jgi:hypothetical protein